MSISGGEPDVDPVLVSEEITFAVFGQDCGHSEAFVAGRWSAMYDRGGERGRVSAGTVWSAEWSGGDRHAVPLLSARRLAGRRLPRGRRRPDHPAPAVLSAVRQAVHHRRGGGARRRQAQRRHRAVQPQQDHDAAYARRARAGPSTTTRSRCWRSASRSRSGPAGWPRCRATRSGWRSSVRCANWTRWHTCGSRASTGRSSRWPTSSGRSPRYGARWTGTARPTVTIWSTVADRSPPAIGRPPVRRTDRLAEAARRRRCAPAQAAYPRERAEPDRPGAHQRRGSGMDPVRPRRDERKTNRARMSAKARPEGVTWSVVWTLSSRRAQPRGAGSAGRHARRRRERLRTDEGRIGHG